MAPKLKHVLFVYGTLKRECHNYPDLKNFSHRFLSDAKIGKEYSLYVSHLPFLVEKEGEGCEGELFLVDDLALQALDRLEGHPRHYKRTLVKVVAANGEIIEAWAYIYQLELPTGSRRITSFTMEDWRTRRW